MIRQGVLAALVTAGLMGGTGCQQEVSPLARLMIQPETADKLGQRIQWQTHLNIPYGKKFKYIEPLGDMVATLETGNVISVLRASDGQILWRDRIGGEYENLSRPVRRRDFLVVSSETRVFIYKIEEGEFVKVIPLDKVANTPPALSGDLAIYGSPKGEVFAQDLSVGVQKWAYQLGGSITTQPTYAGPSLVVTDSIGQLAVFNPASGAIIWKDRTWDRISAQPAATDLSIFVASEDQTLYAFERATGRLRWKLPTSRKLMQSPTAIADLVLQWVPGEGLLALDAFNGQEKWRLQVNATPVQFDDTHILFHHEGRFLLVTRAHGRIVEDIEAPKVDLVVSDDIKGGNLYLGRNTGRLMKLSPK